MIDCIHICIDSNKNLNKKYTEKKYLSTKVKLCVAMYDLFAWKAKKTQIYLTYETTYSLTHK